MQKIVGLCFLLIFSGQLFAQQHIKEQIKDLDKDFRSFQYKKVIEKGQFLLSDPYVTKEDSLEIYKYMLNAAYALADTAKAKQIIKQIIKCDPEFALNPKDTSPKIIEFFDHVKNQIKHHQSIVPGGTTPHMPSPTEVMVYKPLPLPSMVMSILLPGSGHVHQKFMKKGIRFTVFSVALMSGIAYSSWETVRKRDAYMRAERGADFDRLYDNYNRMYKLRNALIGAFVLWDLYALFDLQKEWQVFLSSEQNGRTISVGVTMRW